MRHLMLVVAAFLALSGALRAQEPATPEDVAWINQALSRAQELLDNGDTDTAYDLIARANDYTFERDFGAYAEKWLPNFMFAKYFRRPDKQDWSEVERFAGSVSVGLDTPAFRDRPERTEALLLLGEALSADNRFAEAEPIVEGAFRASLGVWGLESVHIRAAYTVAEVKSLLSRSDADEARAIAFDFYTPGGPIEDFEYAFLRYLDLNARRNDRGANDDAATLASGAHAFLEYLAGDVEVTESDRSFYSAFAALLLAENEEYDQALEIWLARQAYLDQLGAFDREYFLGGQRIAGVLIRLGRHAEARNIMQDYIDTADREGYGERDVVALFYRDLAYVASIYEQDHLEQLYYRKAYAETRRVRSANHVDVLALKPFIDVTASDIGSFAFAAEIGARADTPFQVLPDASDVMRMFLEGNYLALKTSLEGLGFSDPAVLLNRAMASAVLGDYDGMRANLKMGREQARKMPDGPVQADSPYFDLVEVLGTVWGTSHRTRDAEAPLARLAARQESLTPPERSLFLALSLMKDFQEGTEPLIIDGLKTWRAQFDPTREQNVWDAFSMMLAVEIGYSHLKPDEAEAQYDSVIVLMDRMPSLVLAREYAEFVRYMNGAGYAESDEGMAAMGALVNTIRPQVPPDHILQASTQFGYANALWARERYDEAFRAIQSAAEFYRASPYHRADTLAFLLSQQSLLLVVQGKTELGLAIARETYEQLDTRSARADLALTVISNYVYALRSFGDNEKATQIAREHVADHEFMEKLIYHQKAELLINLGAAEAMSGSYDAARRAFIEAEAAVPGDVFVAKLTLSRVSYQRGWLEYTTGNLSRSFDYMSQASDVYHEYRAELARRQTSGRVEQHSEGMFLVTELANVGWEYAQQLDVGSPALSSK